MHKTICLLRHAKTHPASHNASDFDRTLQAQGHQDAIRLGIYLKNNQYKFDKIIASPSVRTKTTALLIAKQIGRDMQQITWDKNLYMASVPVRTRKQIS